jgi:hypothetical protein
MEKGLTFVRPFFYAPNSDVSFTSICCIADRLLACRFVDLT